MTSEQFERAEGLARTADIRILKLVVGSIKTELEDAGFGEYEIKEFLTFLVCQEVTR
jgi:hypothetical protein